MSSDQASIRIQRVPPESLFSELSKVPVFAEMKLENLECLGPVELVEGEPGAEVAPPGSTCDGFYVVLKGEVEVRKEGRPGEPPQTFAHTEGESFGEVPLLKGVQSTYSLVTTKPSRIARFDEEAFWQLMFSCPRVRAAILGNMARRLESYQANAVHREKLASLGTLAAGLMHELNNPGAAALRAASQLRENLARMQEIGLRFTNKPKSQEQLDCMRWLQQQAMRRDCCVVMGSLEQADREEELAEWLEQSGVENAWRIAPGLTEVGMDPDRLACTRKVFDGQDLSDTLNWLESVISNVQLVSTIESSIARVTDLVVAVKKYAYEGKVGSALNVQESLHSTLIILGHKLRHKSIVLRKHLATDLPALENAAPGLNQVWTNLLDNAIDASPEGGEIAISTRREGDRIAVGFKDHGSGITEENLKHIFEPFFTTKPAGSGTGLGLDIARRIVESRHGGEITVNSSPEGTEFTVYLPINGRSDDGLPAAEQAAVPVKASEAAASR
jgi:signal transduction histidine kinase